MRPYSQHRPASTAKGFSVVADEIKDLAERTSFSTREIAELIQAVQQEVKDAILAMDDGLRSVEVGLKVAKDADDALNKIVESSIQSAEMSDSIRALHDRAGKDNKARFGIAWRRLKIWSLKLRGPLRNRARARSLSQRPQRK